MAELVPLQDSFKRMVRDVPRNAMPEETAWNIVDYVPDQIGAPLRKRGGYAYASSSLSVGDATSSSVIAGAYAEFTAGAQLVAMKGTGKIYQVASSASAASVGSASAATLQNPVFHRNILIFPAADGATVPSQYNGTTVAALSGSPPAGKYATVFKDRTLLANSTANPERLWFSDPGDPTAWDTTNTYWDFSYKITGLAALRTAVFVFSTGHVSRLRGSTPPPGTDFVADDPIFYEGTVDARSIDYWGDNVLWMSPSGIYQTDGSVMRDVTKEAGMVSYWQETLASYTSSYTLTGGVLRSYYFYVVLNGGTFVDAGMIDIPTRAWTRISNLEALSMWRADAASDELYFGDRNLARVGKLSTLFMPAAAYKNDEDGTAVAPTIETPYYMGEAGKKTWKFVYLTYDLRDAATDNPILTVSYIDSPEETSYTALTPTLAETTAMTRARLPIRLPSHGLAFKVVQTNASSDTRGYVLEADVHTRESSRL